MVSFDYERPVTLKEAMLAASREGAHPLAGGTDLLVKVRRETVSPKLLVDLKHIPELHGITQDEPTFIGATTTLNQIADSPTVLERFPVLAKAAHSVGSRQVRNRATIGGNVANASPAADTVPALMVLDAQVVLAGPGGDTTVPVCSFFTGPGKTVMRHGEIIRGFLIPEVKGTFSFDKVSRRNAVDLATASVVVFGFVEGGDVHLRMAAGAVAPTPLRLFDAERVFDEGGPDALVEVLDAADAAISPIDDIRGTAAFRRKVVRVLLRRGIQTVLSSLGGDA
ncbi:MAG: xanthine dehydrogenase family protein subunit M [Bacillota bacterium]